MNQLSTHIELNQTLARWLGVESVALVREDLLPDGGGKKRRALQELTDSLVDIHHLHLLSYAGSHTAYTVAKLLPDTQIHLYGTHYGGGDYEKAMVSQLNKHNNIDQMIGSPLAMTAVFKRQKFHQKTGHYFMKVGGSLGVNNETKIAVSQVLTSLGMNYHHFVAVASGDLLKGIQAQVNKVTGILTQPALIRLVKRLSLPQVEGVRQTPLDERVQIMKEIKEVSGYLWDPIFMGSVFSYLKQQSTLPAQVCIWVTCPGEINWV